MADNGKDLIDFSRFRHIFVSPSSPKHIPVSSLTLRGNEKKYLLDVIDRGWLSCGKYVSQLEEQFASYIGSKHAISCSSGTAALHLAYLALGVDSDTTIITTPLTYIATANAARYCGAKVVFADVDRESWCLDHLKSTSIAYTIYEDMVCKKMIFAPVHLYDSICQVPVHMSSIGDLLTVEDTCHGLGGIEDRGHTANKDWGTYKLGTFGTIGCFSFFSSKNIACGEGGMIVTDNDDLAHKIKLYRGQGAPTPGIYYHSVIGYNYRMTEMQAAIALAQLEQLDEFARYRREVIDQYREILGGHPKITLQGGKRGGAWIMAILLETFSLKDRVKNALARNNIETRPFFIPLPLLPPYHDAVCPPIAADIYSRGLCLPTHCELDQKDVERICNIVIEECNNGDV